ncbi:MAG: membrane integrity-associated transporter subunit PqiC [Verrucomicrobiaceae bacterium]|nr:MAG: membrane integrity-associated transporter subunit PqiC [Verrucomicrobiaceae bacterium]
MTVRRLHPAPPTERSTETMKPLLCLLPLLLFSCNVLQPVKDTSVTYLLDPAVPDRTPKASTPAVAINRPSLPSYLDRQQIVTRVKAGELKMSNYHLWAEPLDTGISRVVSMNLTRLKGSSNIQPINNFVTLEYTSLVELRISQFEPADDDRVVLACTWKVQPVHGRPLQPRSFRTEVPFTPSTDKLDLAPRIAAMNEALARLSRVIAGSL